MVKNGIRRCQGESTDIAAPRARSGRASAETAQTTKSDNASLPRHSPGSTANSVRWAHLAHASSRVSPSTLKEERGRPEPEAETAEKAANANVRG